MDRTLYNDGIVVDASDLTNTEETKIQEILVTRRTNGHYGVANGLTCSVANNKVSIEPGTVVFPNGELVEITAPITGQTGASSAAGVSTFVGLRLVSVDSEKKPHETEPVMFNTRRNMEVVVEFFIAPDGSSRQVALDQAISAELNSADFVLLAEFAGNGVAVTGPLENTPLPRSKGGNDPFRHTQVKSKEQIASLTGLYGDKSFDINPIASAEDHIHRSLIGQGNATPNNPHGTTLADIGGDAILNSRIVRHQANYHANGIIGVDSSNMDDFALPMTGSLAVTASGQTITIAAMSGTDTLAIRGYEFANGDFLPNAISMAGRGAGHYYIIARYGSAGSNATTTLKTGISTNVIDTSADAAPRFFAVTKQSLDAIITATEKKRSFINDTVENGERKFYALAFVYFDGSDIVDLRSGPDFTIPNVGTTNGLPGGTAVAGVTAGDMEYKDSYENTAYPFYLPVGGKVLDLRRYGTIVNENVQKRSLRPDRLTEIVITEKMFLEHSGHRVVGTTVVPVSNKGLSAERGTDDTILKHLTDKDASDLFGHRAAAGIGEHALANYTTDFNTDPLDANMVDNINTRSGFQSARDKWKQDNLTMTIFKWADLRDLQGAGDTAKAIADAAAVSSGDPAGEPGAGSYIVFRNGYLKNFGVSLRRGPSSGYMDIYLAAWPATSTVAAANAELLNVMRLTYTGGSCSITTGTKIASVSQSGIDRNVVGINTTSVLDVNATIAAPYRIQCYRVKNTGSVNWKDLTITAEYHYEF